MKQATRRQTTSLTSTLLALPLAAVALMTGCEVDSFFDPSKSGRFEHMPTSIPVLDRIDVIEGEDTFWGQTTKPTADDLLPNDLTYRMVPGDLVTVEIPDLEFPGERFISQRRIDASGYYRLPLVGEVPAAGLTAQEFQDLIESRLQGTVDRPFVSVQVDENVGFTYTIYGMIEYPGVQRLTRPDLRLRDALALAGVMPREVKMIYVIREVPLEAGMEPFSRREEGREQTRPPEPTEKPVDIEELIRQLDRPQGPMPEPPVDPAEPLTEPAEPEDPAVIDIDTLEMADGATEQPPATDAAAPAVDIDDVNRASTDVAGEGDSFVYIEGLGQWVRVKSGEEGSAQPTTTDTLDPRKLVLQRVIAIPADLLKEGDSAYNIVIRPNDSIYAKQPVTGLVYIDGEVVRPGVYDLPADGVTMSRLVAAAGGFSAIAIPERVDLTRMLGEEREATVRMNLAAIRNRTEPDVWLKPQDHIIVGTNWIATPLAVIRNGFRATYGFGFLLDRNFGNDVFGPPPVNLRTE